jgi:hypothetical protein
MFDLAILNIVKMKSLISLNYDEVGVFCKFNSIDIHLNRHLFYYLLCKSINYVDVI